MQQSTLTILKFILGITVIVMVTFFAVGVQELIPPQQKTGLIESGDKRCVVSKKEFLEGKLCL